MVKRLLLLLCAIFVIGNVVGCGSEKAQESTQPTQSSEQSQNGDKLQVYVSFDAMKEFVEAVGKDKVEVSTIIPTGTEPHDFEPKAQDLAGLSKAKVFVYSGLGMEPWAEKAISAANNSNLISLEASEGVDPIKNTDEDEIKEHGQYDPHSWLSLKNAQIEVKNIKEALAKADPNNKDYYEKNCDEYVAQLENLYNEYNEKFQTAPHKNFVTGHAAFGYLCRDFSLEQNSVEDTFAEGEPTPQQLTKLVQYCKDNNVKVIFAEEMASPEISQTLANEVGAEVEIIYTIESEEDNLSYLDRMKSNLDKIYASLNK